jgi:hypothetical protein
MTTANSTLLGLALPVEGELDGTWGDVVNNATTQYLDIAIAGTQTVSTDADVTLVQTYGTNLTTNIGSTTAQYAVINCTGARTSVKKVKVPNASKTYIVINNTTGGYGVTICGVTGPTTGITIAAGDKALVAWDTNASDFVRVGASAGGSNTQVQYNSSGNLAGSANMTFDGTKLTVGNILDSGLTASKPVFSDASKNLVSTGTLGADQGGTGQTSLTLNNVVLGNGTSGVQFVAPGTNGNVLVSNGTTWTSAAPAASGVSQAKATMISMIFGF